MPLRPLALRIEVRQVPAMRWLSTVSVFLAMAASVSAADVRFVRVWPQWRNADAFERIGQYFGRGENEGGEIVLRTHAEERAGLYFLVRVHADTAVSEGSFVLDIIRADSPEAKRFTFSVSLPAKERVVELGLTGADWPGGREAHPVAWKLTLLSSAGQPLATQQSFLWENPSK